MGPDYLFIVSGGVVMVAALVIFIRGLLTRSAWARLDAVLWACLAAALLLQGFAPNLKVERNSFVISASANSRVPVSPRDLVERERKMKLISAVLAVVATAGLLVRHRKLLTNSPDSAGVSTTKGAEAPPA